MKLDDNGAAYFVEMVDTDEDDEEIHPGYNLKKITSLVKSSTSFLLF
jgi:hypothetical protein